MKNYELKLIENANHAVKEALSPFINENLNEKSEAFVDVLTSFLSSSQAEREDIESLITMVWIHVGEVEFEHAENQKIITSLTKNLTPIIFNYCQEVKNQSKPHGTQNI